MNAPECGDGVPSDTIVARGEEIFRLIVLVIPDKVGQSKNQRHQRDRQNRLAARMVFRCVIT
ncbi:hypothetical protein ACFOGG_00005 [Brenneria rubrifaciens]|uniref:hypothetical protein n=1 Tax=Brenneria rubrifaciens TaxID=55213 RepID=UPI0036197976